MWHLDYELEDWFARVNADRAEKYGGGMSSSSGGGRDPEPPMMVNTLHPRNRPRRGAA